MWLVRYLLAIAVALAGIPASLCVRNPFTPVLIVVDGFSSFLGGYCKNYCEERNIYLKDIVSPYICGVFKGQGRSVPEYLRAPESGTEIEWANAMGIVDSDNTYAVSESESGITTADRIEVALKLNGNKALPQLRDKYLANERAKFAGLDTVTQVLAATWEEARTFITDLWAENQGSQRVVLKPRRGVASEGVFCCSSLSEAEAAFHAILDTPQYGGGTNKAVLIQEYIEGPEYAVDTVARDGEIKVLALWRYEKVSINGAPFVCQCTELVTSEDPVHAEICDYCVSVLRAQDMMWGPAHTEIRYSRAGPKLMEVNARWHGQNIVPITRSVLGTDAVTATLDAFFDPDAFDLLPERPFSSGSSARPFTAGMIVHLASTQEGILQAVHHLEEIRALPSACLVDVQLTEGDVLVRTVDVRTEAGYVLLMHADPEVVREDYARILELQDSMFEVCDAPARKTSFARREEQEEGDEGLNQALGGEVPNFGVGAAAETAPPSNADSTPHFQQETDEDRRARRAEEVVLPAEEPGTDTVTERALCEGPLASVAASAAVTRDAEEAPHATATGTSQDATSPCATEVPSVKPPVVPRRLLKRRTVSKAAPHVPVSPVQAVNPLPQGCVDLLEGRGVESYSIRASLASELCRRSARMVLVGTAGYVLSVLFVLATPLLNVASKWTGT